MNCWLGSGEEISVTVWDPPADISTTLCDGARVFGEGLTLGAHNGELNLSGNSEQFIITDRERCPTPTVREALPSFQPRTLTEGIMRRYYQKHNPSKLENGNFLANVMTLTDDEIRSRCQKRYHVAPEPQRDANDI